jgi:hypothetical protein
MEKVAESLKVSLGMYHIDMLHEMAEVLALKPDRGPARKSWFVTELSKVIPKLAHSDDFIRRLSTAERAVLALVVRLGGLVSIEDVARPLLLAGMVHIEGQPQTTTQPESQELVVALMRKGLLVNLASPRNGATMRSWAQSHRFGIAPEVQKVLPLSLLVPPQVPASAPWLNRETPPVVWGGDLNQYMRRLFFAWAELRRQPGRQLKSGALGKRDLRRLAQALCLDDDTELERVEALYSMLVALNLVSGDGTEIAAVDNNAATLFWNATPARQLHDLSRAYIRLEEQLPENIDRIVLSDYLQGYGHRALSEIRADVYAAASQLVPYDWVSFPFFVSYLNAGTPGVLLLGDNTLSYIRENLRWYGFDYRANVETSLAALETSYVHGVLVELANMGLLDLGYPGPGAGSEEVREIYPLALRATTVVRAYYEDRGDSSGAADQKWQVILQPDFQLLAMGPVPLRVLSNLQHVAIHEKMTESVIAYRVTRESTYEALQRGETVESIVAYLEEATHLPVPQNVLRSIEAWSQQYERIVLRRQVRLVQVDTAERLDRLLDDEQVRGFLHRLGECVAWVHPKDAPKVESRLAELKLLVAHSRNSDEDLPESLRWENGELAARVSLPSVYVTGTLSRLAEPHDGRWRVTPETVRTAVSVGTSPLEVINLLERMTGMPLPGEWEKRIKSWGHHYGDGKMAQVRLLRLRRAGALDELRAADAQLHRWLRPLPGSPTLAVVDESHWNEAMALLASWGVEVEDGRWW